MLYNSESRAVCTACGTIRFNGDTRAGFDNTSTNLVEAAVILRQG